MLYEKLEHYGKADYYPFHMPGHKRNAKIKMANPYQIDITEIDGFDNLHCPTEIIKKEMDHASKLYGSDKTYFLINGSTSGILSAISAVTEYGDTVIAARNSHKSVYHALELRGLKAAYLYPECIPKFDIQGGVSIEELQRCIQENPWAKAVILTSPTYEGIVSDIRKLSEAVHQAGMLLIVDEAHGAHFSRYSLFPKSALECGADIVIQSLHKTLPALTQTALLHIKGKGVDERKIEKYLQIYQTSSPSYVLMASISQCMQWLEQESEQDFSSYIEELKLLWGNTRKFSRLHFFNRSVIGKYGIFDMDPSKFVIGVMDTGFSGRKLYDELLSKFHLQMEMASTNYVLAMTSVMDTPQGIQRLLEALEHIDRDIRLYVKEEMDCESKTGEMERAIVCLSISEAQAEEQETILFTQSIGKISGEYVYVYPPGIPVIAPGEMITKEIIIRCMQYKHAGLNMMGTQDKTLQYIRVVQE